MEMPQYPNPTHEFKDDLLNHFDYARNYVIHKVEGTSFESGTKKLGHTETSIFGIVKHLMYTDQYWIKSIYNGEDVHEPWTEDNPDADYMIASHESAETLLADYKKIIDETNLILKNNELNSLAQSKRENGTHPTLYWIILHLIDHTASHNGQLEIYKEIIDKKTY